MKNRRMHFGRHVVLAVFLAFCLSVGGVEYATAQASLQQSEVFNMAWGSGAGQVGLFQGPGENFGPRSFAVNEADGSIYILDSINERISVYSQSGTLLSSIPIKENSDGDIADDLCPGDKGAAFVLYKERRKVVEYRSNGSVAVVYPFIDTKAPAVGIRFVSGQGLFLETADYATYPLAEQGIVLGLNDQVNKRIKGVKRDGGLFSAERKSAFQITINVLDIKGSVVRQIPVKNKEGKIVYTDVIGVDAGENMYIEEQEVTSSESAIKRYVRKYDSAGAFLAEALIPYSNYVQTFKDLRVTKTGSVFQILPLKGHVKILTWISGAAPALSGNSFGVFFADQNRRSEDFLAGDQEDAASLELQAIAAPSIAPANIVSRAESYRTHSFTVTASNITTGITCGGKNVMTPITTAGTYTAVPYKWGGFSGLTGVTSHTEPNGYFFDAGLTAGKYAGDRDTTTTSGSSCAVGVDCSGFISQIWDLSSKLGSVGLTNISCRLPSLDYLSAGDMLYTSGHVRMFETMSGLNYSIIEASANGWNVSRQSYSAAQLANYTPYRNKNLTDAFQVNGRVQAIQSLNVRSCAGTSCSVLGTQLAGATGRILSGPQTADGWTWWEISFDNGVTGWSVQCYLQDALQCLGETCPGPVTHEFKNILNTVTYPGGTIIYDSIEINPNDTSYSYTVHPYHIFPDGSTGEGKVYSVTLSAGETRTLYHEDPVPMSAVAGNYTLGVRLIDANGNEIDHDFFNFTVTAQ